MDSGMLAGHSRTDLQRGRAVLNGRDRTIATVTVGCQREPFSGHNGRSMRFR